MSRPCHFECRAGSPIRNRYFPSWRRLLPGPVVRPERLQYEDDAILGKIPCTPNVVAPFYLALDVSSYMYATHTRIYWDNHFEPVWFLDYLAARLSGRVQECPLPYCGSDEFHLLSFPQASKSIKTNLNIRDSRQRGSSSSTTYLFR